MARPRSANPRNVLLAVRITPRTRFGLELLARHSGRTVSQVVSRAIDDALGGRDEGLMLTPRDERTPVPVLDRVWSPHEYERLVRMGLWFPELLDDVQRYVWRVVQESPRYWKRARVPKHPEPDDLRWDVLAKDWSALTRNARAGGM